MLAGGAAGYLAYLVCGKPQFAPQCPHIVGNWHSLTIQQAHDPADSRSSRLTILLAHWLEVSLAHRCGLPQSWPKRIGHHWPGHLASDTIRVSASNFAGRTWVQGTFFRSRTMQTTFTTMRSDSTGRIMQVSINRSNGMRIGVWSKIYDYRFFVTPVIAGEPRAIAISKEEAKQLLAAAN